MTKRMSGSIERRRASSKKSIVCTISKNFWNARWLRSMTFRCVLIGDQTVEKCHLTLGVAEVDDRRELRQKIRQLRPFIGQIECSHRSIIDGMKLSKQPRDQSLSDAPARGTNDVKRSSPAGHATMRSRTAHLHRCRVRLDRDGNPLSFSAGVVSKRPSAETASCATRSSRRRLPSPMLGSPRLDCLCNFHYRTRPDDGFSGGFLRVHDID